MKTQLALLTLAAFRSAATFVVLMLGLWSAAFSAGTITGFAQPVIISQPANRSVWF